jgi:cell division protein FtsB
MFVLIVFVFITLIICFFLPMFRKQKELAARQEDLKRQIAEQTEMHNLFTRQVDWLKDPDYVATLARDRLDLMKPGETIIRLEPGASYDTQKIKSPLHP